MFALMFFIYSKIPRATSYGCYVSSRKYYLKTDCKLWLEFKWQYLNWSEELFVWGKLSQTAVIGVSVCTLCFPHLLCLVNKSPCFPHLLLHLSESIGKIACCLHFHIHTSMCRDVNIGCQVIWLKVQITRHVWCFCIWYSICLCKVLPPACNVLTWHFCVKHPQKWLKRQSSTTMIHDSLACLDTSIQSCIFRPCLN